MRSDIYRRMVGVILCGVLALAPITAAAEVSTTRLPHEQRIGDDTHPKILAQYGGQYDDAELAAYVDRIGRMLVAVSHQPNAQWTFTVLDSPVVNAFAVPGGYVYVTRGLLALANDEAELAGVLGHEIAHVVAQHGAERQEQSTLGTLGVLGGIVLGGILGGEDGAKLGAQIGQFGAGLYVTKHSRAHELEADQLGVRYLADAGYDPYAQADFLDNMAEEAALQAKIAGKSYNPNSVGFFASHPATGQRVRTAIDAAKATGLDLSDTHRSRDAYLRHIDGLLYGDSTDEGFVRGRIFAHPVLRFEYEVPENFTIFNGSRAVRAMGPKDALLIMDGDRAQSGDLTRYMSDVWVKEIRKTTRTGKLRNLRAIEVSGLSAARARMHVETKKGRKMAVLTVIRLGERFYRFSALSGIDDTTTLQALTRAVNSFRQLSTREARELRPLEIRISRKSRGDDIPFLASRLPFDRHRDDRFATLNGLDDRDLRDGDLYKTIAKR